MKILYKRPLFLGLALITLGLTASSVSAQCPPTPSGPNQQIHQIDQCCDSYLANAYCGIQPGKCVLGQVTPPVVTVTPDPPPGNPDHVHLAVVQGNYWGGATSSCDLGYCGPPAVYFEMVPYYFFNKKNINHSVTYNVPANAWINQAQKYLDLSKLTTSQCTAVLTWQIDPLTDCSVPLHQEIFPLGLCQVTPPTKPDPVSAIKTCNATQTPSGSKCVGGWFDPVDPYSGDYYYADEDLVVPGLIPLKVVRSYTSSKTGFTGPFGVGTHLEDYNYAITVPTNMDGTVNTDPDQEVIFDEGNGLTTLFSNGSGGGLVFSNNETLGTAGSTLTLSVDGSDFFTGAIYLTPQKAKFIFDENGWLEETQDKSGNAVTFTRDGQGKLLTVSSFGHSLEFSYNASDLISEVEDHTDRRVKYFYDASDRLTFVSSPLNYNRIYGWDAQNRIQSAKDYRGKNQLTNIYTQDGMIKQQILVDSSGTPGYQLIAEGMERKVIDPNGNTYTITYNTHGLPVEEEDGLGHTTTITYSSSIFDGTPTGRYIEVTDPLSHTTRQDLNSNNLPTTITDADNNTTTIEYDDVDWPAQPTSITDPMSHETTFEYDDDGNLETITDPDSKQTTMTYNSRGQVLTVTNALNKTTEYEYDESGSIVGDLIKVTDPLNRETELAYDDLSRVTSVTDPKSQVTAFEYDAENRLTKITDPDNKTITYTYDGNANITQIKNKRNNTTNYAYDNKSRLITQTQPGSTITRFYYDQTDRLTKITDPKSQHRLFAYDAANRLTEEKVQIGAAFPITYTYTYDDANNLLTADDGTDTWTYEYDDLNRVTSLESPEGTVEYEYNANGLRTELTATGQTTVTYDYDALDRLTEITQGSDTYEYDYDDIGRRTSLTRPNGVVTSYTYDDANQLTEMQHYKNSVIDDTYEYTYDDNGNILTVEREGKTRTYTYDVIDRVKQMDKTPVPGEDLPKKIEWTYDANSNITQRKETADNDTVTTYAYTYNTLDRLTQRTTNGGSAVTFSYDNNGNMSSDSTGRSFTWNGLDQLTAMSGSNTFGYDPLGRRTSFNSKTYFYDGLDMLTDGTMSYLNGAGIDEPLRMDDGSDISDYLADIVGSVTHLTDDTGASIGTYYYDPYGAQLSGSTPVTGNPFTYTARENDGTGLYFYRNRYYDPVLEVFISQDPLGDAQRYVGGNPLIYVDPFGLDFWTETGVPGEGGGGLHKSICVGNYIGKRFCTSYGVSPGANPFFTQGTVYEDTSAAGPIVPFTYRKTSPQVDNKIRNELKRELGKTGGYNIVYPNCRSYSEDKFKHFNRTYGDGERHFEK